MGCSSNKGTKDQVVVVSRQNPIVNISLNPHNEDEVAEVIEHAKKPNTIHNKELDNLTKMKKDESKTTLAEPSLLSKTLPMDQVYNQSIAEVVINQSVEIKKLQTEKPNFEKVEHKFEFDLDIEDHKVTNKEHHGVIDDVLNELNEI